MRRKLRTKRGRQRYGLRKQTVEPVFGQIKRGRGLRQFLLRSLERMDATLRGHSETIGQRMERDLDALLPLPPVPYNAGDRQAGRVSSLSLVRCKTNGYSVPVAYGHRDALVRATWIRCSSAAARRTSPGVPALTVGTTSFITPSTTCLSWSRGLAPWIKPLHHRGGISQRSSAYCAAEASGNSFRCSGWWRPSPGRRCIPRWKTPSGWGPSASTR